MKEKQGLPPKKAGNSQIIKGESKVIGEGTRKCEQSYWPVAIGVKTI